jgi:hypothetical protein
LLEVLGVVEAVIVEVGALEVIVQVLEHLVAEVLRNLPYLYQLVQHTQLLLALVALLILQVQIRFLVLSHLLVVVAAGHLMVQVRLVVLVAVEVEATTLLQPGVVEQQIKVTLEELAIHPLAEQTDKDLRLEEAVLAL